VRRENNSNNMQRKKNKRREVEIGEEQQPCAIRTTRGVNN